MYDKSRLQAKIDDLKTKVSRDSVTPVYLASVLEEALDLIDGFYQNVPAMLIDADSSSTNRDAVSLDICLNTVHEPTGKESVLEITIPAVDEQCAGLMTPELVNTLSRSGGGPNLIATTWAELKDLRDSSGLVPGRWYRITDYECTTVQPGSRSAGHPFDILVLATSASQLSELARAIRHEGDEYFKNCNLDAWKVWYCLDNDTRRFLWADEALGKGVIYRLVDEWRNDVPYDFKNIQFKRFLRVDDGSYRIVPFSSKGRIEVWCYTFNVPQLNLPDNFNEILQSDCAENCEWYFGDLVNWYPEWVNREIKCDATVEVCAFPPISGCRHYAIGAQSNRIGIFRENVYYDDDGGCSLQSLNDIVFDGGFEGNAAGDGYEPAFGVECAAENELADYTFCMTFGPSAYHNKIGPNRSYGTYFGQRFHGNVLGYGVYAEFGDNCENNTIGDGAYVEFGDNCCCNTVAPAVRTHFGDDCCHNMIEADLLGKLDFTSTNAGNSFRYVHVLSCIDRCSDSMSPSALGLRYGADYTQVVLANKDGQMDLLAPADILLKI